jgi:hypothetical protein
MTKLTLGYGTQWINIDTKYCSPNFYYVNALIHCTNGLFVTSNFCTTLEYDECIVVFLKFC